MKNLSANSEAKQAAGVAAAALVESGQTVGLGTGSTAAYMIQELGRRVREEGLRIECVATSFQARHLAVKNDLSIVPLDLVSRINISIDGADEIDPDLNLIKGGGAAHTLEKLVHSMSERFVVVADPSKLVDRLGTRFAVPVEVLGEAVSFVERRLRDMGVGDVSLRMATRKDGPVVTDNGNLVLDALFDFAGREAAALEDSITLIPGVIANGIFGHCRPRKGDLIIGAPEGLRRL